MILATLTAATDRLSSRPAPPSRHYPDRMTTSSPSSVAAALSGGAAIFLPWPGTDGAYVTRESGAWGFTVAGERTSVGASRGDAERAALAHLRSIAKS